MDEHGGQVRGHLPAQWRPQEGFPNLRAEGEMDVQLGERLRQGNSLFRPLELPYLRQGSVSEKATAK